MKSKYSSTDSAIKKCLPFPVVLMWLTCLDEALQFIWDFLAHLSWGEWCGHWASCLILPSKSMLKHDWSWHLFRKPIININFFWIIFNIYSVLFLILCRWPNLVLKEMNPKTSWKHLWLKRHLMEQNSKTLKISKKKVKPRRQNY